MSLMEFFLLLVVAGVCGAIGQSIAGFSRGGFLSTIAVGFIGALLGTWTARSLNLPELFVITIDGSGFPIVWSIVGSALFVVVLAAIGRGGKRRGG